MKRLNRITILAIMGAFLAPTAGFANKPETISTHELEHLVAIVNDARGGYDRLVNIVMHFINHDHEYPLKPIYCSTFSKVKAVDKKALSNTDLFHYRTLVYLYKKHVNGICDFKSGMAPLLYDFETWK